MKCSVVCRYVQYADVYVCLFDRLINGSIDCLLRARMDGSRSTQWEAEIISFGPVEETNNLFNF